ncbi:MAG: T9SS type A sorting domain-containing protein [Bacteroidota bacterium]
MPKATHLSLFLFLLITLPISAQITITESRFTDLVGKSFREVLYETNRDIDGQLSDLINASGADQSWDFSNLNYVDSTVAIGQISLVSPDDPILNDANFAGSTHLWKETLPPVTGGIQDTTFQYRYGTFSDGRYAVRGSITITDLDNSGSRDTLVQWFSPPTNQIFFPIAENSEWADSTSINQNFMGMLFTSAIIIDSSWVEGWGQLTTPAGTQPALRVFRKEINQTPNVPNRMVSTDIDFLTADGKIEGAINLEDGWAFHRTLEILGDTPTSVSPRILRDFGLDKIMPNPVRSSTNIQFSTKRSSEIELSIFDLRGVPIQVLARGSYPSGEHSVQWSPEGLPAGNYLLRLRVGKQAVQQMVTVVTN